MGSFARPNWTPEEIIKLKELCDSGLYRFDKLAEQLGRPKTGVMNKCYTLGFQNRYRYHLYTHDKAFFSKITPETCYWAGCITTDGCLSYHEKGGSTLTLATSIKDKDHVERFKIAIKATNPIHLGTAMCCLSTLDTKKRHEYCALAIDGVTECFQHLATTFNITPNKTLRANPPDLPSLYHRLCFIRGFIDGDGTLTCGNEEGQKGLLHIGVCGCNREMIAWIKNVIDEMNLPHLTRGTRSSLLYQPKDENCYYFKVCGLRAAILWEILQRLPLPRLSRKWDNPKIVPPIEFWKKRTDVWPSETFFQQYLAEPTDNVTPSSTTIYTATPPPLIPASV